MAGGLKPPDFSGAGRKPIVMAPEVGGPSSAEQLAQMDREAAQAKANERVDPNNVQPGQGYVRAADGRTWEVNGDQVRGYGLNGAQRAMGGGYAGEPNAADREAALARSAEATKFMDRERAAADYRYNISRAMEYRDPLQRALMAKAAGDTYQTRVGGIPTAQTDAELQKQQLVNQGGVQQQELVNQGAQGVARTNRLSEKERKAMEEDAKTKRARINQEFNRQKEEAKWARQGSEVIAIDEFDPDTGQKIGQRVVPKYQPQQAPQQQLTPDQAQALKVWSQGKKYHDEVLKRLKKAGIDPSFLPQG
jgi:hypothetical protein